MIHTLHLLVLVTILATVGVGQTAEEHTGREYFRRITVVPYDELTLDYLRREAEALLRQRSQQYMFLARYCSDKRDCEAPARPSDVHEDVVVKVLEWQRPPEPRRIGELIKIGSDAVLRFHDGSRIIRGEVLRGKNPLIVDYGGGSVEIRHIQFWRPLAANIGKGMDEAVRVFLTLAAPQTRDALRRISVSLAQLLRLSVVECHFGQMSSFPLIDGFPIEDPFDSVVRSRINLDTGWYAHCSIEHHEVTCYGR